MHPRLTPNSAPFASLFLILLVIAIAASGVPRGLDVMIATGATGWERWDVCGNQYLVEVLKDGSTRFRREYVQRDQLRERLSDVFKTKAEQILFFVVDPDISFQDAAGVIDIARGEVDHVVVVPPSAEREFKKHLPFACLTAPRISMPREEFRLLPTFELREVPLWPW